MNNPNHISHKDLQPSLGAAMGRAQRLWREAINRALEPEGSNESRLQVMLTLKNQGEGCSQKVLAQRLCIEMPSLTRTLNQLQAQALVERHADPNDGRAHTLWLTPKGHRELKKLEQSINLVRQQVLKGLTDAQLDALASIILHIEGNARDLLQPDRNTQ